MEWVITQSACQHGTHKNTEADSNRRLAQGPYRYAIRRSLPVALPLALITGTIFYWIPFLAQDTEVTLAEVERQSVLRLFLPTVVLLCLVQGVVMFRRSVAARHKGELHPPILLGRRAPSLKRGLVATLVLAFCWSMLLTITTLLLSITFPHTTVDVMFIWAVKMVFSFFVVLSVVVLAARIAIHDAEDSTPPTPLA